MNYWTLATSFRCDRALRLARTPQSATLSILRDAQPQKLLHRVAEHQHIAYDNPAHATRVTLLHLAAKVYGVEFIRGTERARFIHTKGTQRITYATNSSRAEADLAAIIEGPIVGWYHRLYGRPLLHAAALRYNGQLLAISAEPGTGKSTLASRICARGGEHWSDDILLYDPQRATAIADARPRRLSDAARQFQPEENALSTLQHTQIFSDSPKSFATPIPELTAALQSPQELGHILVLGPRTASSKARFTPLDAPRATMALTHGRYPSWLKGTPWDHEAFAHAAQLAEKVPVTLAHMPQGFDALEQAMPQIIAWCDEHLGTPTTRR